MYNGIGLQTPRGSGTNGYVQRNLAFVKSKKDRIDYKTEEEINKLDQGLNKQPNREILDHERKRKVELKCMEMQELMEEQGYSEKEVANKVNMFRKMLMAKEGVSESSAVDKDEHGRPISATSASVNCQSNASEVKIARQNPVWISGIGCYPQKFALFIDHIQPSSLQIDDTNTDLRYNKFDPRLMIAGDDQDENQKDSRDAYYSELVWVNPISLSILS
ncbi:hypothetical protein RRG08_045001 [Elysia crispata]|uniref:CWF21 domain-containing protein n=1 Tax=Elysia crispata TaxID=231223 RepID=A0AAE0Y3K1_9GAST|nr:hypothetical protein RRG08_045001 [Elysia crispata]